jgi:cbb3-type cytochrome oxidase maturation protein
MSVVVLLVPLALLLGLGFLAGYIWAVRHDQFSDGNTPAVRMLLDDKNPE